MFEEEASQAGGHSTSWLRARSIPTFWKCQDGVKAHHNVGGLPEDMDMRAGRAAEAAVQGRGARRCGEALGLPDGMVYRQPFPGPGLGVRCLGAITRDRLNALREADAIPARGVRQERPGGQGMAVLHRRARLQERGRARRQALRGLAGRSSARSTPPTQ